LVKDISYSNADAYSKIGRDNNNEIVFQIFHDYELDNFYKLHNSSNLWANILEIRDPMEHLLSGCLDKCIIKQSDPQGIVCINFPGGDICFEVFFKKLYENYK
jgi:hypothetical protein